MHGDLKLRVGTPQGKDKRVESFIVCSRTLARASPIFEEMLYGQLAESIFQAFALASHGILHKVPKNLSLDQLYDLTTLTHYYDATKVLLPWIKSWMRLIGEPVSTMSMSKILWVSWELGRRHVFEETAKCLVMKCRGSFLAADSGLHALQMPPGVVESVAKIRMEAIESLLNVFHNLIDNLVTSNKGSKVCQYGSFLTSNPCESMILGSVTIGLLQEIDLSIVEVYQKLTDIIIYDFGQGSAEDVDHSRCNPAAFLRKKAVGIFETIPSPMTDWQRQQIETRNKILCL
ncbi:hypothetical protein B0J13DRAFT_586129 [Dactylonectria estremocensis]|uniref:BTB domain-containing protein n=1 Tax=Dactylonectria estremocensis TaxID=1079267 RepID=A0A9P9J056_9HYPO|nr:hypothetical protein B0J13DRAFT_586129 [Dactylonectria estremocensis]